RVSGGGEDRPEIEQGARKVRVDAKREPVIVLGRHAVAARLCDQAEVVMGELVAGVVLQRFLIVARGFVETVREMRPQALVHQLLCPLGLGLARTWDPPRLRRKAPPAPADDGGPLFAAVKTAIAIISDRRRK